MDIPGLIIWAQKETEESANFFFSLKKILSDSMLSEIP
jgi:hypothetical protein